MKHIAYIEEVRPVATSRDLPRHVATDVAGENKGDEPRHEAATSTDQPRQAATEDRYVAALESENEFLRGQIAVKDEQIKEQSARARETNLLIDGLQRLLAPLLSAPSARKIISTTTCGATACLSPRFASRAERGGTIERWNGAKGKLTSIGEIIDRNIILKGADVLSAKGFTQVPNHVLVSNKLSPRRKTHLCDVAEIRLAKRFLFSRTGTLSERHGCHRSQCANLFARA